MQQKTLGLIHTSATLVPVFAELCNKYLPNVKTFNIVDDSLIKNTIACGELTPAQQKSGELCRLGTGGRSRFYFIHLLIHRSGSGSSGRINQSAGTASRSADGR